MSALFRYDLAISAVSYDALTATRLRDRLRTRLPLAVFSAWEKRDEANGSSAPPAARVLGHEARIVVVMHQRLWGATPATIADAAALEQRAATEGNAFLRVIALEPAERKPWMPPVESWDDLARDGMDATVERLLKAVQSSGGSAHAESNVEATARTERDEVTGRERDTFLHSFRAVAASSREFDVVVAEINRRLAEVRASNPDLSFELRRTPDRCTVQAGPVGFSLSWLRSGSAAVAEGSLMVIEWEGTISFPGDSRRTSGRAKAVREQLLHADAAGPSAWHWSAEGTGGRAYTSRDLAGQCVELLLHQMESATPQSMQVKQQAK